MSLYQPYLERPPWTAWFALVKAESLLAFRNHLVVDTLLSFACSFFPWLGWFC
jgi:hypothetical protein